MAGYSLKAINEYNIRTFRKQPWSEISGSLGDLGTFLPILIALSKAGTISLSTSLIFTGIYNIVTGVFFGLPLPVQPMKAIAAVALLRGFSGGEIAAAGLFVAACVTVFSVTGLLKWFAGVVPVPVVKGIQVGAGLSLIVAAGSNAIAKLTWVHPSWADNYLWVIVAFFALFAINLRTRLPYALVLTAVGLIFAIIRIGTKHGHFPEFHVWHPYAFVPMGSDWSHGILDAGLGQLPLTTLNSIIAVVPLAADLCPDVPTPSVTVIGLSVAAMNFVGVWFGAMPTCHGSGGLAAQYRFGARSGASIIFLGTVKLILGLVLGDELQDLLDKFPIAFITVMVVAAGLELASVGVSLNTDAAHDVKKLFPQGLNEVQQKQRWTVMMVTAGTLIGFKNDAIGLIAGLCCHFSFELANRLEKRRGHLDEHEPLLS